MYKNTLRNYLLFLFSLFIILPSCTNVEPADLVLTNGNFYTVDENQPKVEAVAISKGRIVALGTEADLAKYKGENTSIVDLNGQFAMPGFIEAHGHFSGLGESLMNLNFMKSKTWNEIVGMVAERAKTAQPGEWITGRGWHQEKWIEELEKEVHSYPYHDLLSEVSPNNPVLLKHASGHSLMANKAAMDAAGVSLETPNPSGGEIVRGDGGEAIGVFEETAQRIITSVYNDYLETLSEEARLDNWYQWIALAELNCLENGVTSFQDAGASFKEIDRYVDMAEKGELDVRLWSMIGSREENLAEEAKRFPILDAGDDFFTCRSIKAYADGALGAFGAWMLKPYNDKPDAHGQNVTPLPKLKEVAAIAFENDLQMCTHAIGDRANRIMLNIYEENFKKDSTKTDLRWRMEHAQHIDPADIPRFRDLGVIASMQGIHCTSDSPYVIKRLGEERARTGAYPWRSLLDAGVVIANGTDAPVEDINTIENFYASVTRKRIDNGSVFFSEQSMTREEAVYSYTLGNAYAAFEENNKGSLEVGKVADIVVLSQDLINCTDAEILDAKVLKTIVNGVVKFEQ